MQRPVRFQFSYWAATIVGAWSLVACAVPEWQAPGTPAAQVASKLGTPLQRTTLDDGGERWLYSRQPAGQQVYHLRFSPQHTLQRVEQVLTEHHFAQLQLGRDTRNSVQQYFGPPALVEGVASFKGDVWTYRISENSIDRLAHVFLDPQGVVQRIQFTDEPRSEPDSRD